MHLRRDRFWNQRRAESLRSRSPIHIPPPPSKLNTSFGMRMSVSMGILVCLVVVSMGLTVYAIAAETPVENESNDMEKAIKSRSDYPDYDDLSSFFDFEIGPPSITYKDALDTNPKSSLEARPNSNKKYYYYHSEGNPNYKLNHYSSHKKEIVTPGTHYKSSTEKTFIEGEMKPNQSKSVLNQAKVGPYQVSIVDADSPLLSNLGLSPDDLRRLSGYNKRTINTSMVASDSTPSATYAENPRPNYQHSGFHPSNSQNSPSYQQPYDTSNPPPPPVNHGDGQYKPSDRYHSSAGSNGHRDYNHPSSGHHPPPQGSYDAKSYRAVQSGHQSSSNSYAPPYYNPSQSHNTYNSQPPPPSAPYSNHQAPYNHPPPQSSSYPNPSSSPSYGPQRSSGEPWRQSSHHHTDWDDKKKESWQSGQYPPHPHPLPYSSTSSSTGSYYPKPSYGSSNDKPGYRPAASYIKPEPSSKPSYSSSPAEASSSSDYSPHKPYYSSSSYSSSSNVPSRAGSVSVASSNHHHHHPSPAKPGITIRFKAKAPGGHGGVSIPLSLSPFEVLRKVLPLSSLNPLNNKKVTIGITIENKKDHHTEFHAY